MTAPALPLRRGALLRAAACLLAMGVAGCGRRGPLEPPPDASAPPAAARPSAARSGAAAQPGVAADKRVRPGSAAEVATPASPTSLVTEQNAGVLDAPDEPDTVDQVQETVAPTPTPRRRNRTYVVPKEPFILDPLL